MECRCVSSIELRVKRVTRYLNNKQSVKKSTKSIIIYSKLEKPQTICINTVKFKVPKGLNKLCICKINSEKCNEYLKVGANLYCILEETKSNTKGTQIFILKEASHETECKLNSPESLLDICFRALYLNGIGTKRLEKEVKCGNLPKEVFDQRPKIYSHLSFFGFENIYNICCPTNNSRISSCTNPETHLNINLADYINNNMQI